MGLANATKFSERCFRAFSKVIRWRYPEILPLQGQHGDWQRGVSGNEMEAADCRRFLLLSRRFSPARFQAMVRHGPYLVNSVMPDKIERLYDSGLYMQAVEALQTAVESNPHDASLHYWLGRCFYELRDYSHAMASLERAIALDPNRSEYHDWLGKACGLKAEETNRFIAFEGLSLAGRTHREFSKLPSAWTLQTSRLSATSFAIC